MDLDSNPIQSKVYHFSFHCDRFILGYDTAFEYPQINHIRIIIIKLIPSSGRFFNCLDRMSDPDRRTGRRVMTGTADHHLAHLDRSVPKSPRSPLKRKRSPKPNSNLRSTVRDSEVRLLITFELSAREMNDVSFSFFFDAHIWSSFLEYI